jgi:orotidine-5'-phosphate decarboxylase
MMQPRDRLMVALDMPSVEEAKALIARLGDSVGVYKVGLELLFAGGFELARELSHHGRPVFIDAKLLDIEATVERATAAIARSGAEFLTVHALDRKTLDAAVRGRGDSAMKLLGVTVLTSMDEADLAAAGYAGSVSALVARRAADAKAAGMDGIVAAPSEAAAIRALVGPEMPIITPGIRPAGTDAGDQKRIATPAAAIQAGADYLVVGRPVTAAADPRRAAAGIVREIESALAGNDNRGGNGGKP